MVEEYAVVVSSVQFTYDFMFVPSYITVTILNVPSQIFVAQVTFTSIAALGLLFLVTNVFSLFAE